jgi:hypothetical protein
MFTLIAIASALAGTVTVESENPVGVRVDGNVISPGTSRISVDGLDPGRHVVEITTLSGNPIDSYEVNIASDDAVVELVVINRRLQRAMDNQDAERFAREFGPEPLGDAGYQALLKKLVKGSSKKKFKRLQPWISEYWFTIRQVKDICYSWEKIEERAMAAKMLAPKTIDPENAAAMDSLFPSIRFRQEVHDAFGIP